MHRHEDQGIANDSNQRAPVSSAQFLVEIETVDQFFAAGLYEYDDDEDQQRSKVKAIERQLDIAHQQRQQDAERVCSETQKQSDQQAFYGIAVPIVSAGIPHFPVLRKDENKCQYQDPDAEKSEIFQSKIGDIGIAGKPVEDPLTGNDLVEDHRYH